MRLALLPLSLLLVAGCAPSYIVSVTSWSDGLDVSNKSYCFVAAGTVPATDLEFKEFAAYATRCLARHGYQLADLDKATILVEMSYGDNGPYISSYDTYDEPPAGAQVEMAHPSHDPMPSGIRSYAGIRLYATYVRYVHLAAYDKTSVGTSGAQRWRLDAASSGAESDLRIVMPYLLAAACDYVGTDTGQQISRTINHNDPRYVLVKGIAP